MRTVMENIDEDFPLPNEDNNPPSSTVASTPVVPFDDDDDGLDELAAKACALASVPVPDYRESFARQDRYYDGGRCGETQHYRDMVTNRAVDDIDPNSVVLANKTANILKEFQGYITEMDNESPRSSSSGKKILDYDGRHFEDVAIGREYGGSINEEGGVAAYGLVKREWNYVGYANKQNGSLAKNSNLYIGDDDDDDGNIVSAYSSDKDKKYTLPQLHSKYVKAVIIGFIVLGVILGTTIALSSGEGTDNTHEDPNVRDEDLQQEVLNTPPSVVEAILQEELYDAASSKYALDKFDFTTDGTDDADRDAREFCKSKGNNYDLCPYDVICPLGRGTMPLGGYGEENNNDAGESNNEDGGEGEGKGATWTPIADGDDNDEWVRVSRDESACGKYSDEQHDDPPTWDAAMSTAIIWCCGTLPSAEAEGEDILAEADLEVYVKVFEKFDPVTHGREDGWEGRTYRDAFEYCSREEGYEICSYAAVCPLGPHHEPLGGYKDDRSDGGSSSWVPVSDGPNAWIGVSRDNSCVSYEEKLSGAPEWGITGENDEGITRTLLCCKRPVSGTGEEMFRYEDIAMKHRPNWYDRSEGWAGQTYNEAVAFCLNRAQVLCPYEAYCPMADLDSPLGGVIEDGPNGSWVATSDMPNSWISVGPEDTCKLYDAVNGEVPEWGISGIANEEITRHVMCCESLEEDDVGALVSQEDGDEQ